MQITGGKFNSRKLISPKGDNVRPTLSKTRAAIFDVLYGLINFEGKTFLDLFAGSGIMGLEAVSRGFKQSFAIEKDRKTFLNIKAEKRSEDKNPRQLRAEGLLPATVYGKGKDSMSIQLSTKDFTQAYKKNSEATFELTIDKKAYKTVAQAIQKNYATNETQSVEFKLV